MTTNKRHQDRTGQLSTHNILYQTLRAFGLKWPMRAPKICSFPKRGIILMPPLPPPQYRKSCDYKLMKIE